MLESEWPKSRKMASGVSCTTRYTACHSSSSSSCDASWSRRSAMPAPIASANQTSVLRRGKGVPAILGDARDEVESRRAEGTQDRGFAFGKVGHVGDRVERIAMADHHEVDAGGR